MSRSNIRTITPVAPVADGSCATARRAATVLALLGTGLLGAGWPTLAAAAEPAGAPATEQAQGAIPVPAEVLLVDAKGLTQDRQTNKIIEATHPLAERQ